MYRKLFKKALKRENDSKYKQAAYNPHMSTNLPWIYPTEPLPDIPDMSIVKEFSRTWSVDGRLEITTKKPVKDIKDLFEIAGLILDEYEGPTITRPIYLAVYGVLTAFLKPAPKVEFSNFVHQSSINKRIIFNLNGPDFEDADRTYSWVRTRGQGDSWFKIVYKISFSSTKRPGEEFTSLFNNARKSDLIPELDYILKELDLTAITHTAKGVVFSI